jgi:hypothetical protein
MPSGVRGVSFAYSWLRVPDPEARVRECVRRGIDAIGIELNRVRGVAPDAQVMNRLYWINRLRECLSRKRRRGSPRAGSIACGSR